MRTAWYERSYTVLYVGVLKQKVIIVYSVELAA